MAKPDTRLELWPGYLLIALLPISVFAATDALLNEMGGPVETQATHFDFLPFDSNREAAARLSTLGTFVLFTGLATSTLAFFATTMRLLTLRSAGAVLGAFLVLTLVGAGVVKLMNTREMQDYLGPSFVCTSLGYTPEISAAGLGDANEPARSSAGEKASDSGRATRKVPNQRTGDDCSNDRFLQLRDLLTGQLIATILGVAALVLGSICCLARPVASADLGEEERLKHLEDQSARLNTYLYLSSSLLVTGLFFVAAYAHWPAHALPAASTYQAHANAFVAYLGFSYTLLIASFYAPAAAILADAVRPLKRSTSESSNLPDAFKGPAQVLKIVAAIFSTALAGAIPSILDLGS